jgi:hypothetical protein
VYTWYILIPFSYTHQKNIQIATATLTVTKIKPHQRGVRKEAAIIVVKKISTIIILNQTICLVLLLAFHNQLLIIAAAFTTVVVDYIQLNEGYY